MVVGAEVISGTEERIITEEMETAVSESVDCSFKTLDCEEKKEVG